MIEKDFDIPFIADLAIREKQIQQNYRPIIAVHKWFARRPGTLFRGLLLSEFSDKSLKDTFYKSNNSPGLHVADPFMGGGIPILEANRIGCDVTGFDINPMAWWVVKQEIEHLDITEYKKASEVLRATLEKDIGHLYRTNCQVCGSENAHVKYFLWVKVKKCKECGEDIDLFPGYLIASDSRHPKNVIVCSSCGELTETIDRKNPGLCNHCSANLLIDGPAKRGKFKCPLCGSNNAFPYSEHGPLHHKLFAIEYHCQDCKRTHKGRFFKKPDTKDLTHVRETNEIWDKMRSRYVPDDEIPAGDETNRLHRWGYRRYNEMFNNRQLLGLELSIIVEKDLSLLRAGNVKPTLGDIRCITFGHLIRLAIWSLRKDWKINRPTESRLSEVDNWLREFGDWYEIEKLINLDQMTIKKDLPLFDSYEGVAESGAEYGNISF